MQQILNNNCFVNRNGLKPKYIILHGTAGGTSAQAIANYFASTQGGNNPVSAHYVIGTDGEVVQCNDEADGAWANGAFSAGYDVFWDPSVNPNLTTISIEHCKPSSDNSDTLTDAQMQASMQLVSDICDRWGIPARGADADGGITGHSSIDPVNRSRCPGAYNWDQLWSFLAQGGETMINLDTPGVGFYFEDGGPDRWKCKQNGHTVFAGILGFYRAFGNTGLNGLTYLGLPISEETYPKPGTAVQSFERGRIAYDPNRVLDMPPGVQGDVYLLHTDHVAPPPPNNDQAQIDALKAKLAQIATIAQS